MCFDLNTAWVCLWVCLSVVLVCIAHEITLDTRNNANCLVAKLHALCHKSDSRAEQKCAVSAGQIRGRMCVRFSNFPFSSGEDSVRSLPDVGVACSFVALRVYH